MINVFFSRFFRVSYCSGVRTSTPNAQNDDFLGCSGELIIIVPLR